MPEHPVQILAIEDDIQDIKLIQKYLKRAKSFRIQLESTQTLSEGLVRLAQGGIDLVLLDLSLPDQQGLDTFRLVSKQFSKVPILILSGLKDEEIAVKAVQEGAQDYLIKGQLDSALLVRAIRYGMERHYLRLFKEQINQELERRVSERTAELQQALEQVQAMEVELRRALATEKKLNSLKSQMIETISHEFRTPLTKVLASADLLEVNLSRWNEDKKFKYIEIIQKAAEHMAALIQNIVFLSEAEADRLEFKPESINLANYLAEIIEEVQLIVDDRFQLILRCVANCEPFWGDANLLRQILLNLLSNAIKYSPEGGKVELKLTCKKTKVIIQVSDRGMGISESELSQIFEPFSRGSNVSTIQGIGLGLAIVKRAVESHLGTISVTSRVGRGTTFTIALPKR
jgi:signal transduction histidine kinase